MYNVCVIFIRLTDNLSILIGIGLLVGLTAFFTYSVIRPLSIFANHDYKLLENYCAYQRVAYNRSATSHTITDARSRLSAQPVECIELVRSGMRRRFL